MKKYSKKIALILALTLVLAVAVPALATDTVITGKYKAPDIKVVLPGNTNAIVNPYGLPVDFKNGTTVLGTVEDSQIVTDSPLAGYNYGTVDLMIGATVVGEAQGDFRLATEAPDSDSILKTGLVYFEVKQATGTDLGYTTSPDATCLTSGLKIADVVTALNGWESTFSGEGEDNQILVSTRAVTKNGMAKIVKGTNDGKPAAGSCFIARLAGDIVKAPRDGWKTTDGVKVTVTWILEPAPKTPATPPSPPSP